MMKILKTLSAMTVVTAIGISLAATGVMAKTNELVVYEESFCATGDADKLLRNTMDWYCRAEYLKSGVPTEVNRTTTKLKDLISISDVGTEIKNSTADFKAWIYKFYNNKDIASYLKDNYYIEMDIKVDDYIAGFDGEEYFSAMLQYSQHEGDELIKYSVEEDGIKYLSDSGWQSYTEFVPGNTVHTYKLEIADGYGTMYIDKAEAFSYKLPVSEEYVNIRFGCGSKSGTDYDQGKCVVSNMKIAKLYTNALIADSFADLSRVSASSDVTAVTKDSRYGAVNGVVFGPGGYIEYDLTKDYGLADMMLNIASVNSANENIKITAWDIFGEETEISNDMFDVIEFAGKLSGSNTTKRRTYSTNDEFESFITGNLSLTKVRITYTGSSSMELLNAEIEYVDAIYPDYVATTAGGEAIVNNKISAATGTIEMEFSCDARMVDNKDGDIKLYCGSEEITPVITKEATKIIIKPEDGFLYGKDYKITVADSLVNSGIVGIPAEIIFSTYACDYEAKEAVFNQSGCTFKLKSNYVKDESVAVMIVSYKDGMILDMKAMEASIKKGEEKTITIDGIATDGAEETVVMVWDSLRSRKALVPTIK